MYGAVMEKKREANMTHVCGHQLLSVIDAGHTDLPLANKWVVVGVVGDEESLCMETRCPSQI